MKNIHKILLAALFCTGLYTAGRAQSKYKSFNLTSDGDTINAVNQAGDRVGKWVTRVEEVRGEPGYEEEGLYEKGKKEGIWRKYTLGGDIIAVEFYRFGGKDGVQQYYTFLGDLVREEAWRSYNPDAPYDTIPVYGDGNGEIIDYKIVKAEQYSVKHGEWKYFEPGTGRIVKTETYNRGHLEKPGTPTAQVVAPSAAEKPKEVKKTAEMLEWEKKNKGKKKAWRDGRTGM